MHMLLLYKFRSPSHSSSSYILTIDRYHSQSADLINVTLPVSYGYGAGGDTISNVDSAHLKYRLEVITVCGQTDVTGEKAADGPLLAGVSREIARLPFVCEGDAEETRTWSSSQEFGPTADAKSV